MEKKNIFSFFDNKKRMKREAIDAAGYLALFFGWLKNNDK